MKTLHLCCFCLIMEDDPEEHKHTYKKKTKQGNTKRFFPCHIRTYYSASVMWSSLILPVRSQKYRYPLLKQSTPGNWAPLSLAIYLWHFSITGKREEARILKMYKKRVLWPGCGPALSGARKWLSRGDAQFALYWAEVKSHWGRQARQRSRCHFTSPH